MVSCWIGVASAGIPVRVHCSSSSIRNCYQALTSNQIWFGSASIPAEYGIMGVMEYHIGPISECSDLHEGEIRVMPDVLQHVLEAAVFSRAPFGDAHL